MAEMETRFFVFTCANLKCERDNTFTMEVAVGKDAYGTSSIVRRCTYCRKPNTITVEEKYKFPPKD